MRYNNYHCHSHETNPIMSDSIINTNDYINRALELGHTNVFTTEHGGSRNVFKAYDLCKKNNLKMIFGAEAYYVDDINYKKSDDLVFKLNLLIKCSNKILKQNNEKSNLLDEFFLNKDLKIESKKDRENIVKKIKLKKISEKQSIGQDIINLYENILNKQKKLDRKNYHLMLIALNKNGYYEINRVLSKANKDGMYNKRPRIDLKMLISLPKDDVIITTACVGGRLFIDNYEEKFLIPVKNHFKDNFFLEVQSHVDDVQIKHNKKILGILEKYDIKLIHGCDSHYIYPNQAKDRDDFIRGKGIYYEDEGGFCLDYPSYDEILNRYKEQGVLSEDQVINALKNTLIFDKAEDLNFTKEVKMPTIYPNLTVNERYELLVKKLKTALKNKMKNKDKSKHKKYVNALKYELKIIKETNTEEVRTADYFLLNEKIIKVGKNKYGGILTKTGRGSSTSFYTNNLLGFTEIDRVESDVPLYPTRFMSASRILDSRSMPDIDFNTGDAEPFIQASKDVLGEDGCYYMVAYGKLKMSGAFRLMCRVYNIEMEEYNDFGKLIGEVEKIKNKEEKINEYNKLLKHERFGRILKESEKFVGVIDSIAPSPCSFLLLDNPISTEIGLRNIKGTMCCNIDGYTSDVWKFLKND